MKLHFLSALILSATTIDASIDFLTTIPCGDDATQTCDGSIGHNDPDDPLAGGLSQFGLDYLANGNVWDANLCSMYSLSEDSTNGEMLGDPTCEWTLEGGFPEETTTEEEDAETDPETVEGGGEETDPEAVEGGDEADPEVVDGEDAETDPAPGCTRRRRLQHQ